MIKNNYVFGTIINVIYPDNNIADKDISKFIYQLDDECSIFKENSLITKINHTNDYVKVSNHVMNIIKSSIHYSEVTDGDMDITCKPLIDAIKNKDNINDVLPLVNYKNILMKEPNKIKLKEKGMAIDLGSMVKGYATDVIVDILNKYDVKDALIDLGGNVYVKGLSPSHELWKVGIENPIHKNKPPIGYLACTNCSVVTSGTVERGNHIVNSHTGLLVNNHIKSVSIIANHSIDAEGLSTAFFVKGLSGLKEINQMPDIECIYIDDKRNIYLSDHLKEQFILLDHHFHIKEVNA